MNPSNEGAPMTTEPTDDQITEVVMEFLYLPSTPESVGVRNMAAEIVRLRAELERTRQAWVDGEDPHCEDVCMVACKGPCGVLPDPQEAE